jgi:D-3-phosphoglycerate dehydrogenase / 2-oxoglutarate reductase
MPRVLVTPVYLNNVEGPYRDVLQAGGFEVAYPPEGLSLKDPSVLIEQLQGADAALASVEPYSREVLVASSLRVIARSGVGYDSVDVEAASELGIAVTITPGANKESVAEHAVALMLGVAHGYPARDKEARSGQWRRVPLPRLSGKTLGLVGLGDVGKAIVPLATGLGMKIIAHDPAADRRFAEENGVRLCSLGELLTEVDVVSLHLPAVPETIDMINAQSLAKMKRGAILVNTARGGLVDEDALVDALESGQLAGAGLDVFKTEPLPPDSRLAKLDNALLCPHMAGLDEDALRTMARLAADSIVRLRQGRWPDGRVANPQIREAWKWQK